jgi:hypothetical protein
VNMDESVGEFAAINVRMVGFRSLLCSQLLMDIFNEQSVKFERGI